jgi:hypothetical protein
MSANYIGAFGRVNIGQFDVKRLAQNGCVETNHSSPNFAKVVARGSVARERRVAKARIGAKPTGMQAIAAWYALVQVAPSGRLNAKWPSFLCRRDGPLKGQYRPA